MSDNYTYKIIKGNPHDKSNFYTYILINKDNLSLIEIRDYNILTEKEVCIFCSKEDLESMLDAIKEYK